MIEDVFSGIYLRDAWNGVESKSGPGSGTSATSQMAEDLVRLVDELGARTVLDAACGDGFWMPDLPGYIGIDIAPEAIERARQNHPDRVYLVANIIALPFDAVDLVIFRDAMQHLPLEVGVAALAAIKASGSGWLLASTYVGGENIDIEAGDCYAPDLTEGPFWLGQPDRLIFDGYAYDDSGTVRDPRKHLGLWRL